MQNGRWKPLLIIASVVFSLYTLAPTFFGWSQADVSEEGLANRPGIAAIFPDQGLNLGLDLRGGIYIEFDVILADALQARADLLHSELSRILADKKIIVPKLERVSDTYQMKAQISDASAREQFFILLRDSYGGVLATRNEGSDIIIEMDQGYQDRLEELTMRQAVETIRNRIDKYGVAEPSIQRLGDTKIAVELPGIQDPDRAIELIKRGGHLEFQMVNDAMKTTELTTHIAEVRQSQKIEGYSEKAVQEINAALVKKIPEGNEILFTVNYDPISKKVTGGTPYLLKKKVELTGDMLSDAQVQVQGNEPYVSLTFNDTGAKAFADVTGANVGKQLAIVLDDRVASAPTIQSKISQGRAQITLGFGDYQALLREAEDLTLVLREGALPATLEERTKTVIGPSLGKISIQKGVQAILIGGGLVILFMFFYYRLSGLFANVALAINVLLIFAILTLFQATLTLPGLAGIILTLGMAVDANIIVFERIREEIRDGKPPRTAVASGYSNAMSAIVDANVTTFLAGIILYQFGTGPIRGFAVTLMIGILTTLFTALVVVRFFQTWNVQNRQIEKLSI